MDIKSVFRSIIPSIPGKAEKPEVNGTTSKMDADNDREGNGQASQEGEEQKRRPLTPEEFESAISYLKSLPGIKDHNLTVKLVQADGISNVYIEDAHGKIVRRIPETELRQLTANREKTTGRLINRAM